jgi:2-C-methyl-D-erythritol 2,4-cyclodiphosphate synthase
MWQGMLSPPIPGDSFFLEFSLKVVKQSMRVGFGYDVHAFGEGRPLVLGGVSIPHHHGLLGHSDADVLLHAISDALLGAAALGDIGLHFPDFDPAYEGISSLILFERAVRMVREHGFEIENIDTTLVLQRPRLAPHILRMVENISSAANIDRARVNVKATTSEGLGFTGREEGIAAYAVVLLKDGAS